MSLLYIVIVLIVVGILLWLVNTYIPMDGKIKTIVNIVVVIAVVIWLLKAFGVWGHLADVKVSMNKAAINRAGFTQTETVRPFYLL